jgi:hypothetical protein
MLVKIGQIKVSYFLSISSAASTLSRAESTMEKTLVSIERMEKKEAKQRKQDDEMLGR